MKAVNRAAADNQSAQAEEEGLEPTKEWVKDLIDEILARGIRVARSRTHLARRGHRRQGRRSPIRSAGENRRCHAQRAARRARSRSIRYASRRPAHGAHRHGLCADRGDASVRNDINWFMGRLPASR